jgi:aminoglycoside phosphotransferase (APT) family kinase protein
VSTIELPWRRDPGKMAARLAEWFAHVLPPGSRPEVLDVGAPAGTGMSSETLLVDVAWSAPGDDEPAPGRYVVRLAPDASAYPVFPSYDLELQRRCLQLVGARTTAPVPAVPWHERDPSWLGSEFLVMTRIDGVAPVDIPPYVFTGWLVEAAPEDLTRLQAGAVDVLARLHVLDAERDDLAFLGRPEHGPSALDQALGGQRAYYEWAREGVRYPVVERLFDRLEVTRPPEPAGTIVWGDARIGNILFRDFTPVAVLDWEMAAWGPAEIDVAWMIWMHAFFQDLAERAGAPGLPGLLRQDDVAAAYEAATGRTLGDLDWYIRYAILRHAIITIRTSMRGVVFGQATRPDDPDDLITFRPIVEAAAAGRQWR